MASVEATFTSPLIECWLTNENRRQQMALNSRSTERRLFRDRKFRRGQHRDLKFWHAIAKHCNRPNENGQRIVRLLRY